MSDLFKQLQAAFLRLLRSKRFFLMVVGILTVVLNETFELGIPKETISQFAAIIVGFIVGDSIRPVDPEKADKQQKALK